MFDKIKTKLGLRKKTYENTFTTDEGKLVLAEIYNYCGLNRPSYVEGNPDRTAYNEGRKSVALHIKGILKQTNVDIDKFADEYQKSLNYNPTERG